MQSTMSKPFALGVRRFIHQSPAEFLRQCRTDASKTLGGPPTATSSPKRTYFRAVWQGSQRCLVGFPSSNSPAVLRPNRQARSFSNSAPLRTTTILQNPRVDDDGNEMTIEISDRAAKVRNSQTHHYTCLKLYFLRIIDPLICITNAAPPTDNVVASSLHILSERPSPQSPSCLRHVRRLPWLSIPHVS